MNGAPKYVAMLAALAVLLAGCGLRGPLYLPEREADRTPATDAPSERKRRIPTPPAPQSQKERDDGRDLEDSAPVSPPDPDRPAPTPRTPSPEGER